LTASPKPRRPLSPARLLMVFAGLAVVFGVVGGLLSGSAGKSLVFLLFVVILGVFIGWTSIIYWRRLDEAAREAHKFAWYWGGSTGLLLCGGAVVLLGEYSDKAWLWPGLDPSPVNYLYTGIMTALFTQIICYGIVWAGWWLWNSRS
jgi:hypothetical protein